MLLEEIYPVAAYYQDTCRKESRVRVAGLGSRCRNLCGRLKMNFIAKFVRLLHQPSQKGTLGEARPLATGTRRTGRLDVAAKTSEG